MICYTTWNKWNNTCHIKNQNRLFKYLRTYPTQESNEDRSNDRCRKKLKSDLHKSEMYHPTKHTNNPTRNKRFLWSIKKDCKPCRSNKTRYKLCQYIHTYSPTSSIHKHDIIKQTEQPLRT